MDDAYIRDLYSNPRAKPFRAFIARRGYNPDMLHLRGMRTKGKVYLEQYICAMKIFIAMFIGEGSLRKPMAVGKTDAWVHLVAEMQAGKTGVCHALVRIIRMNILGGKLPEEMLPNIFFVTGLSDKSWCEQMIERLSDDVSEKHIYHSPTLEKLRVDLETLHEREGSLRDVLIFVDESHIASSEKNRPNQNIYSVVHRLLPDVKKWTEQNVHIVTVSATDPRLVLAMAAKENLSAKVVALETGPDYQSVESLNAAGRIRNATNLGSTPEAMDELREAVEEVAAARHRDGVSVPCYHIVRAEGKTNEPTVRALEEAFGESADVKTWDAESNKRARGDASTVSTLGNINDMLSVAPEKTTFIVIKRMFSCAKTMVDTHVGVMWDYVAKDDKDSVRLQSLLGRACGYGRSKYTLVYTSGRVVEDYLSHWRDAMRSVEGMKKAAPSGSNFGNLGVGLDREGVPFRKAGWVEPVPDVPAPAPRKTKFDDADFDCVWSPVFRSLEEAKAGGWGRNGGGGKPKNGFYRNRLPGRKNPMTEEEYGRVLVAKKTWLTAPPHGKEDFEVGAPAQANFVFYENPADPSTARFVYKVVTRTRAAVDPGAYGPPAAGGLQRPA